MATLSFRRSISGASRRKRACGTVCLGLPELLLFLLFAVVFLMVGCGSAADPISGLWNAQIITDTSEPIAFQLDVKREGDKVTGALVNGPDREEATAGSFDGKTLTLKFNFYDAELIATLENGKLGGEFTRQRGKTKIARKFTASKDSQISQAGADTPNVAGDWILTVGEGAGQRIWSATLAQDGAKLSGTVIPISGDWGTLSGYVKDGKIYLSRFDGIRALLWTGAVTADGRIEGRFDDNRQVIAERVQQAMAQGAKPQDPETYTTVKDPSAPFTFEGLDVNGKNVRSTDSRFKDKVVIVTITGTWCPNCHEEAPVLVDLYKKYKDKGLEIVALAYEYTGDTPRDLEQLKIYAQRHSIEFPLLLAGTTESGEIARTLPQLVNFGAYPTTIYVNRQGKVDAIHAGFEGKSTGDRHTKLVASIQARTKKLLEQ